MNKNKPKTMRDVACEIYLGLNQKERSLIKERFKNEPSKLERIEMYEEHERTGNPLPQISLFK